MWRILGNLKNRLKSQGGACDTHLQVDKVLHIGQGGPQQITHQFHVPLLYSQMQNSLVTFDFLEIKKNTNFSLSINLNPQGHRNLLFYCPFISVIVHVPKRPLSWIT